MGGDLMLHPGGHGVPKGWLTQALDWFEDRLVEDHAHLCTPLRDTLLRRALSTAAGRAILHPICR